MNISDYKFETGFMVCKDPKDTPMQFVGSQMKVWDMARNSLALNIHTDAMTIIKKDDDGILAKVTVYILTQAQMDELLIANSLKAIEDYEAFEK